MGWADIWKLWFLLLLLLLLLCHYQTYSHLWTFCDFQHFSAARMKKLEINLSYRFRFASLLGISSERLLVHFTHRSVAFNISMLYTGAKTKTYNINKLGRFLKTKTEANNMVYIMKLKQTTWFP